MGAKNAKSNNVINSKIRLEKDFNPEGKNEDKLGLFIADNVAMMIVQ
ncbi:hypothetical protein PALB_27850 [Pseudoalteromonas luteoviolacea B = ATCC 29581]|nr:hypothetical protein PALB_27850 [Pseudoalteromonas luteoviolacea B = ATCC 29581]